MFQAWLTLPSCLANSSSPTLARMIFCSLVIVGVLSKRRGRALRIPTTPRPASASASAMTPTVRLSLNYCNYDVGAQLGGRIPGLEFRSSAPGGELMHLKGYCVDHRLLRTGSANFSRSGETRQDNGPCGAASSSVAQGLTTSSIGLGLRVA